MTLQVCGKLFGDNQAHIVGERLSNNPLPRRIALRWLCCHFVGC